MSSGNPCSPGINLVRLRLSPDVSECSETLRVWVRVAGEVGPFFSAGHPSRSIAAAALAESTSA